MTPQQTEVLNIRTGEIPAIYDQLLAEYIGACAKLAYNPFEAPAKLMWKGLNPLFQMRLWRSDYIRDFLRVPNALKQELPDAPALLSRFAEFDLRQLQTLRRCNEINLARLSKRMLINYVSKPIVGVATLLGIAESAQKAINRDLLAWMPDASQVTYLRDSNGNLRQTTDGRGKNTIIDYDGFDRVKRVLQPAGTEEKLTYDAQSNVVSRSLWGHPGGLSPSGNNTNLNIETYRASSFYDERNRLIQVDQEDPQSPLVDGALTPGDAKVTTVFNYDRLNRIVYTIDDDTSHTEQFNDGASRPIKNTDPVGNIVEVGYDDNNNPVLTIERDIYPSGYRSFETFSSFDALGREISITDNLGHTERTTYDSRGYSILTSDPAASLSSQYVNGRQVNNPGNTIHFTVDGLGRVVLEELDLRVGGTGDGVVDSPPYNADGRSTRTFTYDANGNLEGVNDDTGKETAYEYDSLDRLRTIVYEDGSQFTQDYDQGDNVIFWQDAVGTQTTCVYDDQNRLTAVDALIPASVVGTTKLRYEFDGLDRLTKSIDSTDSILGDANDWISEYAWDARGRSKTQIQNNRMVSSAWQEEAKRTSIGYSSGVTVLCAYDALERLTVVTQGIQLAAYTYAGESRLLERTDYAGVAQRYHDGSWNDSAYYDGARRPIKLDFKKGGSLLTGIEEGFDRASNRLFTRRLHNASKGDNFIYDSMYRLVTWERSVAAADVGIPGGNSFDVRHGWDLDGAQSRRRTTRQTSPTQAAVPTVITVDDVHNYVTKQTGTAPPFTTRHQSFDLNGNKVAFTSQGTHSTYIYDFLNRLRVIQKGSQKVEFDYDGENRRVRTRVTGIAGYPVTTEFVHDGEHVIEEYDGAGICLRRFYYGDELDELVAYDNLGFSEPGSYFYQQDSAGNVVAIHNQAGVVVERYSYGVYGSTFFETPLSESKGTSKSGFGNPYTFKGLRFEEYFDALCYVRARFLDCQDGSFMQRDPIGIWGDLVNAGNPKAFCGGNPINRTDPLGEQPPRAAVTAARVVLSPIGLPLRLTPGGAVIAAGAGYILWQAYVNETSGSSSGSSGSGGRGSNGGRSWGPGNTPGSPFAGPNYPSPTGNGGTGGRPANPGQPAGSPGGSTAPATPTTSPANPPAPSGGAATPAKPADGKGPSGGAAETPKPPKPPTEIVEHKPPVNDPHYDKPTGEDWPWHWHWRDWDWHNGKWWPGSWQIGGKGSPPRGGQSQR